MKNSDLQEFTVRAANDLGKAIEAEDAERLRLAAEEARLALLTIAKALDLRAQRIRR